MCMSGPGNGHVVLRGATHRTGSNKSSPRSTVPGTTRVVSRYGRLDLLLLDELSYVRVDPRGAELLFQIITEREERASIAIGTNLPFSRMGHRLPRPRLVAAIVDRVTFNAHILETGTQSYRLRTSKTTSRSRTPS
jgi:DNA replication protein DnaC